MEKITIMFLWAVLALFSSNCSDSQQVRPIDKLGARLVAYDEDGTERTVFEANTNITFGLSLINKSNVNIEAGAYYEHCDVYQKEDFLLIYKLIRQDNGEEKWMPYGKPYQQPAPCPTIPMPVMVTANGETKLHGRAWNSVPDNPPFTAGKYYTAFAFTLELDGQSRRHDLKLEFEVY
jgi:hypothetical protein